MFGSMGMFGSGMPGMFGQGAAQPGANVGPALAPQWGQPHTYAAPAPQWRPPLGLLDARLWAQQPAAQPVIQPAPRPALQPVAQPVIRPPPRPAPQPAGRGKARYFGEAPPAVSGITSKLAKSRSKKRAR